MSSLSSILRTGLTALQASQNGLKIASQNIANANTPGYVRTEINFSPLTNLGAGAGIDSGTISRAADRFLATAAYMAEAARGASQARAELLARAQASFGDPSTDSSVFAAFDRVWDTFTELGVDPSSSLRRDDAVSSLQTLYAEIRRTAEDVQILIAESDERIGDAVSEAQDLINQIAALNDEVRLTLRTGADASAVENAQSAVIDRLSALLDIRVTPLAEGGVHVRTSGGAQLVGEKSATLSYASSGASFSAFNPITYSVAEGSQTNLEPFLVSGELKGLLQTRDVDLRQIAETLGGLAASIGDALNAVHNENTSYPAVGELTGRQTGLLATDALNFSGNATIGVTNADGELTQRFTIDFDAGQIIAESPAGAFAFGATIASFTAALDLALGAATPAGNASFVGGRLSLDVGSGGGLVLRQDESDPSDRAGRGFAHFFGLNDLVSRPAPLFFETGGSATDLHGLVAGGELSFMVKDLSGRIAGAPVISISGALTGAGSTWADIVSALNNTTTGLGQYATFSYDSNEGRIVWTANTGFALELTADTTQRGATGVSMSSLFGLGASAGAARAVETDVAAIVSQDPTRLAVGRPDLTAAIGERIMESGDNRGANALARARDDARSFAAVGSMAAQTTSLATYVSRLAGTAGRLSTDAQRAAQSASALSTAATDRRAQVEGVSIDDELIRMTTYQNAYAAASRLIQAANEMFEVLLQLGRY